MTDEHPPATRAPPSLERHYLLLWYLVDERDRPVGERLRPRFGVVEAERPVHLVVDDHGRAEIASDPPLRVPRLLREIGRVLGDVREDERLLCHHDSLAARHR